MLQEHRLKPEELTSLCILEDLPFENTKNLKPIKRILGQKRGVDALRFGLQMKRKGYNIYVSGIGGTGRSSFTNSITEEFAKKQPVPNDWVYVYNFNRKESPKALRLGPGQGKKFKDEVENTVGRLKIKIPEAFVGMEYVTRKSDLVRINNQKKNEILKKLNEKATEYGFIYTPTDDGLLSIPVVDDRPMNEEEYQDLDIEERETMMIKYSELQLKTFEDFSKLKGIEEELAFSINEVDKIIVYETIHFEIKKIMDIYMDNQKVLDYLLDLENDILDNIEKFKRKDNVKNFTLFEVPKEMEDNFFIRYKVNLFVDNSSLSFAPIINESNPIYNNLVGTIEFKNQMGVLVTDFTQIKPGSLHLANGGYLIFQMKEILNNPISWEMLKRALKTDEINIDNQNKLLGVAVSSSIKPEPIPLDIKIIIIGDEYTYSLLYDHDEDFQKLFKVIAVFDIEMNKNAHNINLMAEFIARHCEENGLRHFTNKAVARVVQYSTRLTDHKEKLSIRFNKIIEIMYEADFWAGEEDSDIVTGLHVKKAIDKKIYRLNKYEQKLNEMFLDGTILMDLEGEKIGQINGLAVMGTGEYSFGKPSRITATVYRGEEGIINIEREAKQSGSLHDKGVFILSGYLGEKYAKNRPLGLTIGLGFEQSYSLVDGDSASSTELYAILSSISGVPIKQYIAVTGSVNQKGEIQPIGGVNEKIEGFYDICNLRGLTGNQGVLIPKKNVNNLVLKDEVIESVRKGEFHIYAIEHIEEGIEILTGLDAGKANSYGEYPEGTLNYIIMNNLDEMLNKEEGALG
jgi:lon-related putative ATP-dependent protease